MHVTGIPRNADVEECCTKPWRSLLRGVRTFTESVPLHVRTNGGVPPAAQRKKRRRRESGGGEEETGLEVLGGMVGGEMALNWGRKSLRCGRVGGRWKQGEGSVLRRKFEGRTDCLRRKVGERGRRLNGEYCKNGCCVENENCGNSSAAEGSVFRNRSRPRWPLVDPGPDLSAESLSVSCSCGAAKSRDNPITQLLELRRPRP
ncbi:hypothetical protein AMECASPLE_004032 [Ameca splendens]|uniref:Uncharacterized protein n=1 Tax=Ameca splendens TaxID=208324 RepID=A0ABV0YWT2_9TELE